MYLERFEFRRDPLRNIDCRCRLLCAALFLAAVVTGGSIAVTGTVILSCAALLFRDCRVMILRLIPANAMALAVWISAGFGYSGMMTAFVYSLRINAAALLYMVFLAPLGTSALAAAMISLKAPAKLAALFVLTWRYVFLLYESIAAAVVSMRQRAGRGGGFREWKALGAVFAAALVRAFLRAEKVTAAMHTRGFDGELPVTVIFSWGTAENLLLAGSAAFLAFSAARPFNGPLQ
jgi:energy-coupling factor transporter transmembrane protein EcfT